MNWLTQGFQEIDLVFNNPESLLSEESRNYYAIEAVRAYIYAKQNKLKEALEILDAIAKAKSDTIYMETWGIDWLSQPGAMESLSPDFSGYILANALNRFAGFRDLTYTQQQYLLKYAELARKYLQLRELKGGTDQKSDAVMKMMYVGLLRKAGCFREALEQAKINRRDTLYSLLLGDRDWTTIAAIIALACLAEEYPVISFDIATAFKKLADAAPNTGACCYEHALYYNWLRLPHLFEKEREELKKKLQDIEND